MEKRKDILITGGSGMIGTRLTTLLREQGYNVAHLGRSKNRGDVKTFIWHPQKNEIENGALRNIDVIIHLAGAGIADKRWNAKRKQEILRSRTESARLLKETISKERVNLGAFISASGISFYGLEDKGRAFVESDHPATDFMSQVTTAWEREAEAMNSETIRVVRVRTGVVLSRAGGALKKLAMPVKFFVGAPLGSGKQFVNWIHIDDLCRIYIKAIEDLSMRGPYNAVAPNPVTNQEFTREVARVLGKPLWLPAVPAFAVKLMAGEVAEIVLKGGKISAEKIQGAGFDFRFKTISEALEALYRH